MASANLIPAAHSGELEALSQTGPLIRRPAELVELTELVYRGIFGAGLLVASIATLYATALGALQPREHRVVGIVVCSLLLLGQLLATHQRTRLFSGLLLLPWVGER